MTKTIVIPYKPRGLQQDFHNNIKRWNFLVCHRRFGKTVMAINQLIRDSVTCTKERPRYAYIAPTYRMAKSIVWDYLKHYTSVIPGVKYNEAELRVDMPNNARITLLGGENIDALRGIYLDGCVMDEYAQMRPSLFTEVISPCLSDRKGYAVFIGTPKGKNHFYDLKLRIEKNSQWYVATHKASQSGYVDADELVAQREAINDEDVYNQEYECSFDAAIKGAFYADSMADVKAGNRICKLPYDPNLEVHTYWDIGFKDDTAIIFVQLFGKEIRIIDSYCNRGMTMSDYAKVLKDKGYNYGRHFFPWDAKIKPMSSGKSTIDVAREHGIYPELTPSLTILEGINQGRLMMKRCWFDEENNDELIRALSAYRREYDEKRQAFKQTALHDWSCLTGDTKIRTLRGWVEIKDVKEGDYVWGYSEKDHRLVPALVTGSKMTKPNEEVIEIGLDNGKSIKATPEHLFMTRDEKYVRADSLKEGDSLMPFYEQLDRKYIKVDLNDGTFADEHRFVYSRIKGFIGDGLHVDHINQDRFDNSPDNLQMLCKKEHCSKTFKGLRNNERKNIDKTDDNREFYSRGELYQDCGFCKKEYWGSYKTAYCCKKCKDEEYKKNNSYEERCKRDQAYKEKLLENGRKRDERNKKKCLDCDKMVRKESQRCSSCSNKKKNHKVRYIKKLTQRYDTYDLCVPETSNFVAEGVVVHNSHYSDSFRYMSISIEAEQDVSSSKDYEAAQNAYMNTSINFDF